MKIRPVGDGQTDKTNLIIVFRNFANAPKERNDMVCTVLVYKSRTAHGFGM